MAINLSLSEIIVRAIPNEECPVKNAGAMHRREVLEKRIKAYIEHQLSNQFNAKVYDGTPWTECEY